MSQSLNNILIIKPSALGDVIHTLPALTALRRSFPDAKISWLIRPEFAPVLEGHPDLDEIILFERKLLGKALYSPKAFKALISLIEQLRKNKYDAVFDFQSLFRTAIIGWLSGCNKRYGLAHCRELAHLFYNHRVEYNSDCIHLVDFFLKMVQAAGAEYLTAHFILPINQAEIDSANKLLAEYDIEPGRYVVLVPGSAQIDKCWPADHFAQLAEKISSEYDLQIVTVGTGRENDIIEQIKSLAKVNITNIAGKTSLKVLIALLKNARLVVSNDTGPGHIAAALGTPLVIMYSWSNPARIAPYGRSECMIARDPYTRGLKIKSTNPKHLVKNIAIEEVYEKVQQQLDSY